MTNYKLEHGPSLEYGRAQEKDKLDILLLVGLARHT